MQTLALQTNRGAPFGPGISTQHPGIGVAEAMLASIAFIATRTAISFMLRINRRVKLFDNGVYYLIALSCEVHDVKVQRDIDFEY